MRFRVKRCNIKSQISAVVLIKLLGISIQPSNPSSQGVEFFRKSKLEYYTCSHFPLNLYPVAMDRSQLRLNCFQLRLNRFQLHLDRFMLRMDLASTTHFFCSGALIQWLRGAFASQVKNQVINKL